jgi:hypothetical protein
MANFPPLDEERRQFLAQRLDDHLRTQPTFLDLVSLLLSLPYGGQAVVASPSAPEPHLERILSVDACGRDGCLFTVVPGATSACHRNSIEWVLKDAARYAVWTGYALSDDGLWRQHSWVEDRSLGVPERFIETTETRLYYYGVRLTTAEIITWITGAQR